MFTRFLTITRYVLVVASGCFATANADPYVSLSYGNALNASETITIEPDADAHYEPITFEADFESRGLKLPPFYSFKLGWSVEPRQWRWEVELLHQKLHVPDEDLPPQIEHFEVTHGFNLFLFNLSHPIPNHDLRARFGVGTILAHPDIYIYDENGNPQLADPDKFGEIPGFLDDRYFFGGYAVQLAVQKHWALSPRNGLVAEIKLKHAKTRLPVYRGEVDVPNTALSFLLGYEFGG